MANNKADAKKVSFKGTLNLPRTEFPIRAQAKIDDPAMIKRWKKEKLSVKTFECHAGNEKYILHDGPPYANGNIHIGHAYNKILKDIIAKSHRMMGYNAPVVPGWDCHGLPIELKVSQEHPDVKGAELKKACRAYAQKWVDIQSNEFQNLGVMMDWEHPYLTMNPGYEGTELRCFGELVAQGYIERKNKTVPWCPSCKTVLAQAEIEYQERKDPSIYVLFQLEPQAINAVFPQLSGQPVNLLVWTTTPWTLPLNRAVLLKPKAPCVVLDAQGTYIIVGKQLADKICELKGIDKVVVAEFTANDLTDVSARAVHPFIEGLKVPVLLSDTVLLEDGTACVHSAPGCGPEDYEVGIRNGLEIFSPISPDGHYTKGIEPHELEGMAVADGQIWVLKKLAQQEKLFIKKSIRHPYPYCWRCRGALIFRATKQWFCDLAKHQLKEKTLVAIEDINTVPAASKNRLRATVEGRLEWCLSRQRVWGVPIVALICTACDESYTNKELIDFVADKVAHEGIEYWDRVSLNELPIHDITCTCSSQSFKKETDILDVWFDSGISHTAVLKKRKVLHFPADVYVEGKDQHRGWFQSSLLTSMALNDQAPMKNLITHGFTVDKNGRKMSKSLGNVVSPHEMIDRLGTDGLRLWVSSIECGGDAVVSDVLLKNVSEVFRKIRNTCRFMLSNLYDFDIDTDALSLDKLMVIDQYALQELFALSDEIIAAYQKYDVTAVFHAFGRYCAGDLSSFYLDIIKDRLYVEQADGYKRRSAQTACWYILDTLTKLMAPILSFTAEQLSDYYEPHKQESIHLQEFADLSNLWQMMTALTPPKISGLDKGLEPIYAPIIQMVRKVENLNTYAYLEKQLEQLKSVRSAVLKAIEGLREQGIVKHSLEAAVTLYLDTSVEQLNALDEVFKRLAQKKQSKTDFFKELFIVSKVTIAENKEGLSQTESLGVFVYVERAKGKKCPRCWHITETKHEHDLCDRCAKIVG